MGHQVVQRKEMIQGVLIERERERDQVVGGGGEEREEGSYFKTV